MSNAGVTTGQIKNMRRQTLGILDDLVKKSKAYEISDPPTLVEEYRLKLLDNTYKVLVVGEMKRGKSSFVNALIGRDILPTDVDIATCEVFRVRRAMKEAYRVRFEDGSAQEIPATQLKKYGSHGIAEKILSSRLAGLKVASQQFYTFQQEATERRQGFDDAWGANGKKSQELMTNIQRVTTMHKRSFVALLEPNGEIETKYRHEIDAVESSEDAKKLSEVLDESLVTELLNEWRTICEQAYDECISLLAPFIEATDELLFQPEVDQPDLVMRTKSTYDIKNDLLTMIKEANTNLSTGIQVSACFVLTIGSIAGILFPPAAAVVYAVGIPAVLAMGTWSGVQGWKNIQKKQLQDAQQELHSHLTDLIREARMRFLQADLAGGLSVVNHYFNTLVDTIAQRLHNAAEARSGLVQAESARLDRETRQDEQQRKLKAEQVQQQLTEWDAIGHTIEVVIADLKRLDQSL